MYYYILGFGIACLILAGISSMDTVYVKPAQIVIKALLWPLTLLDAAVHAIGHPSSGRPHSPAAL